MQDTEDGDDGSAGQGFQVELLKAYIAFGKRAVRARWLLSSIVVFTGTTLAVLASLYWPRTFACTTVLMAAGNPVLDTAYSPTPLAGASNLIMRHENLEAIIRDTDLIRKSAARRPPILKLKDRLMKGLVGELSEKTKLAILVATVESRLDVTAEKGDLTVKATWSDGTTATELAEAARQSFVKDRHTAEMSAFEEKMAIFNEHVLKLRDDIGGYADQVRVARTERLKQARGERAAREKDKESSPGVRSVTTSPEVADGALPALRDKLAELKRSLAEAEAERERRLHEAQAKYDDMQLHLTASHPDVITQGERVAMLTQVPSGLALMRAEEKDLEAEVQQREGFARGGTKSFTLGALSSGRGLEGEALPPDITELLRDDDGDPALTAQLSSAVQTYALLGHTLLTTRIELDTAQAAFNHRYQVIIPAEVPPKPSKPNPGAIVAIGTFFSLLIALGLPAMLELKKGVLTERWQVEHQLPVLAEIHLPPYSGQ